MTETPKEQVQRARQLYLFRRDEPPTQLFLSNPFHEELLVQLRQSDGISERSRLGLLEELKTLKGRKFLGMTVHIVDTLKDGFYVA